MLALLTVLLTALAAAGAVSTPSEEPTEASPKGEEIYRQRCAVCHGFDGIAVVPETPSFGEGKGLGKPDRELLKVVEKGTPNMPAWNGILSKAEQRDVLAYVRTLWGKRVFERKCVECHSKMHFARSLMPKLPKINELQQGEDPVIVCRGTAVEKTVSRKEVAEILKYVRTAMRP